MKQPIIECKKKDLEYRAIWAKLLRCIESSTAADFWS